MAKILVVFLAVAVICGSYGMTFQHKSQSGDNENSVDDRYGWDRPRQRPSRFPNQNQFPWDNQNQNSEQGQFPWQNQNGGQGYKYQQPTPKTNTGEISRSVRQCITDCPVTSEFNPVCGSNGVTYSNPGRLGCAKDCGVSVTLASRSSCPTSTVAPTK